MRIILMLLLFATPVFASEESDWIDFFKGQVSDYESEFHAEVTKIQLAHREAISELAKEHPDHRHAWQLIEQMREGEEHAAAISKNRSKFIKDFKAFFDKKYNRKLADWIPLPGPLDLYICVYFLPRTLVEDGPSTALANVTFDMLPDLAQIAVFTSSIAVDTAMLSTVGIARIAAQMDALKTEWRRILAPQGGEPLTSASVEAFIVRIRAYIIDLNSKSDYPQKARHLRDLTVMINDLAILEDELFRAGL